MSARRTLLLILLCVSLSGVVGLAAGKGQDSAKNKPKIIAFGSDSPERGTTRVGYWNREKNQGAGQFAIDYGRPVWRADYEDKAKFDSMTKGKVYRLGANFWTTFDSDIPVTVAGVSIPAGHWFLGLHRSEDGATWSLAFIDPAKASGMHLDASEIGRAPIAHKAAMKIEMASEKREKLTIDLLYPEANPNDVTLRIGWGNLQLTAPIAVSPIS